MTRGVTQGLQLVQHGPLWRRVCVHHLVPHPVRPVCRLGECHILVSASCSCRYDTSSYLPLAMAPAAAWKSTAWLTPQLLLLLLLPLPSAQKVIIVDWQGSSVWSVINFVAFNGVALLALSSHVRGKRGRPRGFHALYE